ncbi:hypothetical protein HPB50_025157 [Hyalomma asiaticum]|uniref:Uncharacterized protein n=1 Tax=Hyalomma asiaticum TaxID=266040 RepID=A0ACB7TP42_HYAAI|nr:hypothetical protein HPB50_025157 [Hyalomma asiaticum]
MTEVQQARAQCAHRDKKLVQRRHRQRGKIESDYVKRGRAEGGRSKKAPAERGLAEMHTGRRAAVRLSGQGPAAATDGPFVRRSFCRGGGA